MPELSVNIFYKAPVYFIIYNIQTLRNCGQLTRNSSVIILNSKNSIIKLNRIHKVYIGLLY